jgi:hypothetical protein
VAGQYPAAIAFGMSMTTSRHVQQAVDELTAAGTRYSLVENGLVQHPDYARWVAAMVESDR